MKLASLVYVAIRYVRLGWLYICLFVLLLSVHFPGQKRKKSWKFTESSSIRRRRRMSKWWGRDGRICRWFPQLTLSLTQRYELSPGREKKKAVVVSPSSRQDIFIDLGFFFFPFIFSTLIVIAASQSTLKNGSLSVRRSVPRPRVCSLIAASSLFDLIWFDYFYFRLRMCTFYGVGCRVSFDVISCESFKEKKRRNKNNNNNSFNFFFFLMRSSAICGTRFECDYDYIK